MKYFIADAMMLVAYIVVTLMLLCIFIGILSVPIYYLEATACEVKWTDRPSEFSFFGGCLAEHEGVMVPSNSIRFEGETQ